MDAPATDGGSRGEAGRTGWPCSTAAATCVLIVFGGLVTNTGAALAVPDWPTTFGHNMFLFPWSRMVGGVFYEHSHRLLGSLVGLLTVALAARSGRAAVACGARHHRRAGRRSPRALVGGLRVVLLTDGLAHGARPAGPGVLRASWSRSRWSPPAHGAAGPGRWTAAPAASRWRRRCSSICRSCSARSSPTPGGSTFTWPARVAVFVLVPMVTARPRRSGDAVAAPAARLLLVLLGCSSSSASALRGALLGRWIPGGQLTMLALPVAHR